MAIRSPARAWARASVQPHHLAYSCMPGGIMSSIGRHLPVPKLPNVVVLIPVARRSRAEPAEEDVASMPASGADPRPRALPRWRIPICLRSRREPRSSLFGLQEEGFRLDSGFQQQNPCPGADAAHSDHLVPDVSDGEVIDQDPEVGLEGVAIGRQEIAEAGCARPRDSRRSCRQAGRPAEDC